MRMVALFLLYFHFLSLFMFIKMNSDEQVASVEKFSVFFSTYKISCSFCSLYLWMALNKKFNVHTHQHTDIHTRKKIWNYDDRSNFLWFIPYTRSTAEKKLQILQAMHIHELNWELCIDLRFVLCIGMMEMAKKYKS